MKIFVCTSKAFYGDIAGTIADLKQRGFEITLPNNYETPYVEDDMRSLGDEKHGAWKADMLRLQATKVASSDALLIMNLKKNDIENYIGGAVLLEMYEAFRFGKPIYLWNPIPENMLKDEVKGMQPVIINGDLSLIQQIISHVFANT